MRNMAIVTAAALVLAACSRPDTGSADAADAGAAAPAEAAEAGEIVAVSQLPTMRPGRWRTEKVERDTDAAGETRETGEDCVTADAVGSLKAMAAGTPSCRRDLRRVRDGYVVRTACEENGVATRGLLRVTGDFQTRVVTDLDTTVQTPGQPPTRWTIHMDSRWVGACSAEGE